MRPSIQSKAAPAAEAAPAAPKYPEFPKEGSGSKVHYWLQVLVWALRSAWIFFNQLPRWVRAIVYVWLCVALLSKGCSSNDHSSSGFSRGDSQQLHAISDKYHGSFDKKDISKLAAEIARIASDDGAETPAGHSQLLAIPFTAPTGNAEAAKIADSTFALVYGKVVIAHRGKVGLSPEPALCDDSKSAVQRGRSNHSAYVLCGAIGADAGAQNLTIKLAQVSDGSVLWSKSYPVAGADPTKIAEEVNSHVPALSEE